MSQEVASADSIFARDKREVESQVKDYVALHRDEDVDARNEKYTTLVNHYYDLATDFYEYGWGRSFHFAPRMVGESFDSSLRRHERFLSHELRLAKGMRVLDIGCGVGGPMMEIARYSGATVIGVNNNAYQIKRGRRHVSREGLNGQCSFEKADFMKLPFEDESVDAVYTIEASCHAPDKTALFKEVARVLKPGGEFAGYEWCLTDGYDGSRQDHRDIKKGIEVGDGLPDIAHTSEVDAALENAGFKVMAARDVAHDSDPETPWFHPLTGNDLSLRGIPRTPVGRTITGFATRVMERVGIAPKGTCEVSDFLNEAADALVAGGRLGIFTPMYYFRGRKPS